MTCPIKMACLPPICSCLHVPFGHYQAKTMITFFNNAKSIDLTLNFREELHIIHNSVHSILPRIIHPLLIHLQSIIHESKNPQFLTPEWVARANHPSQNPRGHAGMEVIHVYGLLRTRTDFKRRIIIHIPQILLQE